VYHYFSLGVGTCLDAVLPCIHLYAAAAGAAAAAAAAVPGGMRSRTVAVGTLAGGVVSMTEELCLLPPPRDFALRFCAGSRVTCLHGTSTL
jgi:hypothetical protein